jgi:hypothetical protein
MPQDSPVVGSLWLGAVVHLVHKNVDHYININVLVCASISSPALILRRSSGSSSPVRIAADFDLHQCVKGNVITESSLCDCCLLNLAAV